MPSKGAVLGSKIFGLSLCICVWVLLIPYLIGNDGTDFNPVQNLLDNLLSQKVKEVPDNYNDVIDPILTSLMAISIVYAILFFVSLFSKRFYDIQCRMNYPIIYHVLMITHLLIGSIIMAFNYPGIELLSMYSAVSSVVVTSCIILTGKPLAFVGAIMYLAILFTEVIPGTNLAARFGFLTIFIAPLPCFLSSYIIWNDKEPSEEESIPTKFDNGNQVELLPSLTPC